MESTRLKATDSNLSQAAYAGQIAKIADSIEQSSNNGHYVVGHRSVNEIPGQWPVM